MKCVFDLPDDLCFKARETAKDLSISDEAYLAKAVGGELERDGKHESPVMLINKLTFHRIMDAYSADIDLQRAHYLDLKYQLRDVYKAWRERQITDREFFSEVEELVGIRKPSPAWTACPDDGACPCEGQPCAAMVGPDEACSCGDGCACVGRDER